MADEWNLSKLGSSLEEYADALRRFLKRQRASTKSEVLNMLLARDGLYAAMNTKVLADASAISPRLFEIDAKVEELDKVLKRKGDIVAVRLSLGQMACPIQPPGKFMVVVFSGV